MLACSHVYCKTGRYFYLSYLIYHYNLSFVGSFCRVNENMATFKTFYTDWKGLTTRNAPKTKASKTIFKLFFLFLIIKYYIVLNLPFAIPSSFI